MEGREEGLIKTAALLALGITRKIRTDLNDWKEWLVEEGKEEFKGYRDEPDPRLATKSDIKALSDKIEVLMQKPSEEGLLRYPPEKTPKDHRDHH